VTPTDVKIPASGTDEKGGGGGLQMNLYATLQFYVRSVPAQA